MHSWGYSAFAAVCGGGGAFEDSGTEITRLDSQPRGERKIRGRVATTLLYKSNKVKTAPKFGDLNEVAL